MSKKRKAESDQHTTLLDFFNASGNEDPSSAKRSQVSKKQRTISTNSGSPTHGRGESSGKAVKGTVKQKQKNVVPEGAEIIELLDSDEEVPQEMRPVESLPRTPERPPFKHMETGPQEIVDLTGDGVGMTSPRPPFIDCSAFFLDSPERAGEGDNDDFYAPEGEVEREVSTRLERMSPTEWGLGDDEGFSDGAGTGTGASEPEDEMDGTRSQGQRDQEATFSMDEEIEEEPHTVQLIELSDDDEADVLPVHSSKEMVCPICQREFVHILDSAFCLHVNKCMELHPVGTPSKGVLKKGQILTPLSSLPVPPHPDANLEGPVNDTENIKPSFNAFAFLMSRSKENEAWKEATEAEKSKWGKMKQKGKGKGSAGDKSNAAKGEDIEEIGDEEGHGNVKTAKSAKRASEENGSARRAAPFYKVMQGMPIAVDAFRYGKIPGVTAYLLTHAHSDHYTNLSSSWKHGPIYCSQTTANLIIHMLSVDPKWVHPLPMDSETELPDTGGVKVTLIEANHCPGSCLFFFEGKQTANAGDSTYHSAFVGTDRIFRYLHCGDFRACPQHVQHPSVRGKRLDLIYLDTTYLDPKYCFPPQRMVIDACAELATRIVKHGGDTDLMRQNSNESKNSVKGWLGVGGSAEKEARASIVGAEKDSVLVVFGTYTIGKERIVKATARALNTLIWCEPRKRAFFECQASLDPELQTMIGDDPLKCGIHVRPLQDITSDKLLEYLELWKGRWSKVVGLRPTGWTYTPPSGSDTANLQTIVQRDQNRAYNWSYLRPMRNSTANVMLYGVPYSEHSSFFELTCFALSIQYVRMIATVNVGSSKSRAKMNSWFEKWEAEKKRREKIANEGKKDGTVTPRHHEYW